MISIVAAIGKNRELGYQNRIPWHIKEDLQHFKALTTGKTVIIGRKTLESLFEYYRKSGRSFPPRQYLIISHNNSYKPNLEGLKEAEKSIFKVFSSVKEAIDFVNSPLLTPNSYLSSPDNEIFLIGGASIYNEGIQYADKLYLTLVEGAFKADTFFPDYSNFKLMERVEKESAGQEFAFCLFEK